jgi:predicted metal-dependent hydrolase
MPPPSPTDELAEIRAEIARLRHREATLRQTILDDPDRNGIGRWHRIEVEEHRDMVLDITRLPEHILQDRSLWREKLVRTLRCLPAVNFASRPGWPMQRANAKHLH